MIIECKLYNQSSLTCTCSKTNLMLRNYGRDVHRRVSVLHFRRNPWIRMTAKDSPQHETPLQVDQTSRDVFEGHFLKTILLTVTR